MAQNSSNIESEGEQFLARLPIELSRWESDGIITAEQGQAILGGYTPAELTPRPYRAQGRLVTGLSVFGSVLVGLGIILFFAANWG